MPQRRKGQGRPVVGYARGLAKGGGDTGPAIVPGKPEKSLLIEAIRRQLGDWIAQSPITSRVMVNRIWQWHFGHGLVPSPNDFGSRGEMPMHPELLDWLAAKFVASDYSVKPGIVHGATDDIGLRAEDKPVHVHVFHATILHLMDFDHEKLTYRHAGRDYRLTDVEGHVVKELLV